MISGKNDEVISYIHPRPPVPGVLSISPFLHAIQLITWIHMGYVKVSKYMAAEASVSIVSGQFNN